MNKKFISKTAFMFFLLVMVCFGHAQNNQVYDRSIKKTSSLRILTLNVWSGLDYEGTFRMGEYEKKGERDKRFQLLVKEIKKIDPDVIFLQEANPVQSYSARLARALQFDKIYQVTLGGIKLGPLGIPSNLKEGNAILARSELQLKTHDVWKLSGSFGLFGDIFTCHFDEVNKIAKPKFEFLPILMWDTDIGFGYGIKLFYLNPLKLNESFDLVIFNSTKGEQWYRLVFSWPDFEHRQGKIYPISLDLTLDYDKYLKNNYFGIGNESAFEDREVYTREPLEITMTASRGFNPTLVGQFGLRYKTVNNYNFEENSRLKSTPPDLNVSRATVSSIYANLRFDTRDSYINPSTGLVLQGETEYAFNTSFANVNYQRIAAWFHYYKILLYPKTILALRLYLQNLFGDDIPIQFLLPIGGGSTLRGSPQDRYLGKTSAIFNGELRFPLIWRFGGVVGFDAGKVWDSLVDFDLKRWATNPTIGLRFYMTNFLVRLDIGLGKDSTGLYFNFGHVF